jgi:hypothetical protein
MPKKEAEAREDEVLELVCTALSNEHREVAIAERPDRDGVARHLTVDALLRVKAEHYEGLWAVDLCLASHGFDPQFPAAMRALEQQLRPKLDALAAQVQWGLTVTCTATLRPPRVSRNEWRRMMYEYERNIIDRARLAFLRQPDHEWYDSEVGIRWLPGAPAGLNGELVELTFTNPLTHAGFRFSRAVSLKLKGQLKRAHEAGYPTLLILDQKAPSYVRWVSHTLPEPVHLGEGLSFLASRYKASLNAGALIDYDNVVHEIYGTFGDPRVCPTCRSKRVDV